MIYFVGHDKTHILSRANSQVDDQRCLFIVYSLTIEPEICLLTVCSLVSILVKKKLGQNFPGFNEYSIT